MSIKLSDTTTKRGLVQFYEKELGLNYGDISGNTEAMKEFVAQVNNTLDDYLLLWFNSAGTWQGDDINHTNKYNILTMNIVSGQRDYTFDLDQNSNKIIDISKVSILQSSTGTEYIPISPVDELENNNDILVNNNTGTPFQYGKIGNSIFLDPVPSYSVSNGIKMLVNREGSYFTTGDTDKIPGVPVYHEYFYLKPAYNKACILGSQNLASLEKKVIDLEGSERLRVTGKIQNFFSKRERDKRNIMSPKITNFI